MWTRRSRYITESKNLIDYLEKEGHFHDFLIASFTYDSQSGFVQLTIEEDDTWSDQANSPSLIWDLECQAVSHFLMESMEGFSKWWISEVLFDGKRFSFS